MVGKSFLYNPVGLKRSSSIDSGPGFAIKLWDHRVVLSKDEEEVLAIMKLYSLLRDLWLLLFLVRNEGSICLEKI